MVLYNRKEVKYEMQSGDIRKVLEDRIAEVQKEISNLQEKRGEIDQKLKDAERKIVALREVYMIEAERFGEQKPPLLVGTGVSYRFAGMKLTEALQIVRTENPKVNKKQARKILEKEGFDFRNKRPGSAVHFAWVSLDRRKPH
jgi:hypothetical protein